jgi:glycerol kinase
MCEIWGIPTELLPDIRPTVGHFAFTKGVDGLPDGIPITAAAGDQHAALFGQGCVEVGQAKCTYGTGAFVLVNTGGEPRANEHGLLSTLAWQIGETPTYALEGAAFIAGAAVQWLRDGLGLIKSAPEVEALALEVESSDGVTFVPALAGLGAPHWDPNARGLICGLTRGSNRGHIARATLEGISFQVCELLELMESSLDSTDSALGGLRDLRVDGGACKNDLLMQMQSDHCGLSIHRPEEIESTARGAGLLAGLGAGLIPTVAEAAQAIRVERIFSPSWDEVRRRKERERWEQAVKRARCC